MTAGIRLGRAFGAPIVADASAFALAVIFAAVVLVDLRLADGGTDGRSWVVAAGAGVLVVGSVVAHELSHAWIAVRRGLHVREIRIYMFGGYSVIDGSPTPATEASVALAGPVASLVLGALSWGIAVLVGSGSPWGRAFVAVALANLAIGLFNLLPGFPLDGGRVLRGVLSARGMDRVRATGLATMVGQWTGWASIGAGLVVVLGRNPAGLLLLGAGWFLVSAARTAGRREQLSAAFDGLTVRDAMRATPEAVPGTLTVSSLLDLYGIGPRLRSLPVEMDGRVVGVIGQEEVDAIAPSRWPSVRVRSLMTAIGPADVVEAGAPLETLLLIPAGKSGRAVVADGGVVVGIIEGADLGRVLPT